MKIVLIICCLFVFASCDFIVREGISTAVKEDKPEVVEGDYYRLQKDNISIFLPNGFITISDDELLQSYQVISNEKTKNFYEKELESRKNNKVTYTNFYNEELQSEVYVSGLPYMPFDKRSAQQLLYYLRKNHEKYLKYTGIYHHKLKANYWGDNSLQIFKALYRLSGLNSHDDTQENDVETFKSIYLITSKKKTIMITILTPNRVDIDPYIRKIKF